MEFHHIGVLTLDLRETLRLYVAIYNYNPGPPALEIEEQEILVCSLERPGCPRIELIQPLKRDSTIGRLAAKGTTGYHLAWSVPSLDDACASLDNLGFHALLPFNSPLWEGRLCRFCAGPGGELVEFIEILSERTSSHENHPNT